MRDFLKDPAHTEADLGVSLPDVTHACSVCLPTWASVVGYEEGRDKVIRRLRAGYPRFFRSPLVARATLEAAAELCDSSERLFLFPTRMAAQRAQRWIERRASVAARSSDYHGLQAVIVPKKAEQAAINYQRYTGEMISSRLAEDFLNGELKTGSKRHLLQRRMGTAYGVAPANVSVFSSGMAAITAVIRSLPDRAAGRKTLQLEFPYVDSLKVQEVIGNGVVFLNKTEGESFDEALRRIRKGEFAAVFTEVPSNPLLRCCDLPRVAEACAEGGTPLVVDDSAAGPANVQALKWADVVTCSLTKWLSGGGDVMAGAAIVRPGSPFEIEFNALLKLESEQTTPVYLGDIQVLLANLKGYPARMKRPNETAMKLVEFLAEHPAVEEVWHPSRSERQRYEALMSPNGGFGGLLSFVLKAPKKTAKFYDALALSKGPGFGTAFSLVCPYVMLAHYHELDWAAGCEIPAHLIRVSCGQEAPEVLLEAFAAAFRAI